MATKSIKEELRQLILEMGLARQSEALTKQDIKDVIKEMDIPNRTEVKAIVEDVFHEQITEYHHNMVQPEFNKINKNIDSLQKGQQVLHKNQKVLATKQQQMQTDISFIKDEIKGIKSELSTTVSKKEMHSLLTAKLRN